MSLRASYARLTKSDADALRADLEFYRKLRRMAFDLNDNPAPAESEWIDLDREWLSLSWLCSPVGRAEERNFAAFDRVMERKAGGEDFSGDSAFKAALAQEAALLGFSYVDPDDMPDDPVLSALQGRRGKEEKEERGTLDTHGIDVAIFSPSEVAPLATALANLNEADMREAFDIDEMEALGLPNDGEESDFDDFYMPQLRRLQTLYARAAEAEQSVAVIFRNEFIMVVGEPSSDFWEDR